MSYNGVGLSTARGSGTNGYVQKNLSSIKSKPIFRKDAVNYLTAPEHQARSGNSEILTHEKKRQVEIKCLELEDKLTAQGMDEDEIEDEIDQLRQKLLLDLEKFTEDGKKMHAWQTHQLQEQKEKDNKRFGEALGIKDYNEGDAFNQELQRIAIEKAEREQRQRDHEEKMIERATIRKNVFGLPDAPKAFGRSPSVSRSRSPIRAVDSASPKRAQSRSRSPIKYQSNRTNSPVKYTARPKARGRSISRSPPRNVNRRRSPSRSISPPRNNNRYRSLSPSISPRRSISPPRQPRKRVPSFSPRRSISPRKRSISPPRQPRKRAPSFSPRRSISPRKRSISPPRQPRKRAPSFSPRRSISPRKRSISPPRQARKRSLSRSISPKRQVRNRSISPPIHARTRKLSMSPPIHTRTRKTSFSPRKRSPSPRRRSVSRSVSPRGRRMPISPPRGRRRSLSKSSYSSYQSSSASD